MFLKEYEVTVKCGVLMTNSLVRVAAATPEEAVELVKLSRPSTFVVEVNEVADVPYCTATVAVADGSSG